MTKHYDALLREVRFQRLPEARRGRRWRWDVTRYRRDNGPHSGAAALTHLGGDMGYTRTYLGALIGLARSLGSSRDAVYMRAVSAPSDAAPGGES